MSVSHAQHQDELAQKLIQGNRRALSRAITLTESNKWEDNERARTMVATIARNSRSKVIGISGAPGVGKSSFIEAFGLHAVRQGLSVAVLAVDPSSATGGGAILGDKTRMMQLARAPQAYVRPSPSGVSSRGIAHGTYDAISLCEASGFDLILVETVGVGQAETAVRDVVDCFVLLVNPAGGDSLQGIKRGIMELADLIIVHKADKDLVHQAEQTAQEYTNALALMRARHKEWQVPLLTVSSHSNTGIDDVFSSMTQFFEIMKDVITAQRRSQKEKQLRQQMDSQLQKMLEKADLDKIQKIIQFVQEKNLNFPQSSLKSARGK